MLPRACLLAGVFCLLHPIGARHEPEERINILWIGNSLTSVESLPALFSKLAARAGVKVNYQQITYEGWLLVQHAATGSDFRTLLDCNALPFAPGASWDFVVLQDDSQLPGGGRVYDRVAFTHLGEGLANTLPVLSSVFAPCIFGSERSAHGRAVIYQTWGLEHGDRRNPDIYPSFEAMTNLTVAGCDLYADRLSGGDREQVLVARAGEARLRLKALRPECHSRMYASDDGHPSLLGHYLDACVFLRTLRPRLPLPHWAPWQLAPADASLMRAVAMGEGLVNRPEAVCAAPRSAWSLLWWAPPSIGFAAAVVFWQLFRSHGGERWRAAAAAWEGRPQQPSRDKSPTRMELLTIES